MATIHLCDRCGRATKLSPAFGATAELCASCVGKFDKWWAAGKREGAKARATGKTRVYGDPYKVACELIAEHGYAAPQDMAEVTGRTRRDSYFSLQHLKRCGLVEGGMQVGMGVRFYLREQRGSQQAAE